MVSKGAIGLCLYPVVCGAQLRLMSKPLYMAQKLTPDTNGLQALILTLEFC